MKTSTCSQQPNTTVTVSGTTGECSIGFSGSVAGATGGCETANICIASYVDTAAYSLTSGSAVSYDFTASDNGDWYEVGVALFDSANTLLEAKAYRGKSGRITG
eukprot:7337917-Prymnesium_polylepis.1